MPIARSTRRAALTAVLLAAAAVPIVAVDPAAHAVAPTSAVDSVRNCTIVLPAVTVSPPLGLKAVSDGAFHSTREGTVTCGSTKGSAVIDGRYGVAKPANCLTGGDGWGVLRVTLGGETFGDTATFEFGPNKRSADAGNTRGERIDSSYVFVGTTGNCAAAPISEGTITMTAKIRPAG